MDSTAQSIQLSMSVDQDTFNQQDQRSLMKIFKNTYMLFRGKDHQFFGHIVKIVMERVTLFLKQKRQMFQRLQQPIIPPFHFPEIPLQIPNIKKKAQDQPLSLSQYNMLFNMKQREQAELKRPIKQSGQSFNPKQRQTHIIKNEPLGPKKIVHESQKEREMDRKGNTEREVELISRSNKIFKKRDLILCPNCLNRNKKAIADEIEKIQ